MSAIKGTCKLNPEFGKQWKAALGDLAFVMKRDNPEGIQQLATLSAGRFIKNVAAVTPPATGTLDSGAKARGEQAVLDDLLKLAVPVAVAGTPKSARSILATAEDLLAAHQRSRVGASGRVNPRSRKEKLFVTQATFNTVLKQLQSKVGFLAAALNAAAEKLGVRLPMWIKRHGERFGRIDIEVEGARILIRITHNGPFVENVKDYGRHWDFAIKKELNSLHAQIRHVWDKQEAKARSRLK